MRSRFTFFVLLLLLAASARADVLVNDRSDPVGPNQFAPRVTTVYNNNTLGTMVVVAWSVWPNTAGFRYAVAPIGTLAFTQGGTPPAPTGYRWLDDDVIHGAANDVDGFFYLSGLVRLPTLPPTTGLGFVRGRVDLPGSVSFDPPQLLAAYGTAVDNVVFYGMSDMQVHPADGTIFVLYQPEVEGGVHRNVYLLRSTNGGASWSSAVQVSNDSLAAIQFPSIACGNTAGDVTLFWQQSDANGAVVMSRHSSNSGATLDAPVTVMHFPPANALPPSRGGGLIPSVTGVRWGASAGALLYGATVPPDLQHDVYPPVSAAPAISEVEPNNTFLSANAAGAGNVVLRGTISAVSDTDQFAFDLVQGQEVNALDDSMAASPFFLHVEWAGPDGVSVLTSANLGVFYSEPHFGFVAPATARYYLRVTGFNVAAPYRLRTVWGTTPPPGALDQRDVAFSRLPSAGSWTGTQPIAPADPLGYDATGLALGAAVDGAVYAAYGDFSVTPGRALSRRVVRRSIDGGATWSAPVAISTSSTDWRTTSGFDFDRGDLSCSDGVNLFNVWTDGRNGDPDVYLDRTERRIYVVNSDPASVTARRGEPIHVIRDVRNADVHESFGVRMLPEASGEGWSLASTTATLAPGETRSLDCGFQVPYDATLGDHTFNIQYKSQDNPDVYPIYGIVPITVHVTTTTGVDAPVRPILALAPVRPNPLIGPCDVRFSLTRAGHAKLMVYGIDGRVTRTLLDAPRGAGLQSARWDGRDDSGAQVAAGEYFVVLKAEGRTLTRRIVALR